MRVSSNELFSTLKTELKCEVPSSLSLQSQHYSAFKSHTTLKGLVAIAPNGSFIFLSELFGGSISDRALFEKSGVRLLDSVPPGKSVMADRGFEVQDLLVKPGLILNAPPFKGSRTALTEDEVKKTQKIAQVRIHAERAIREVLHSVRRNFLDGMLRSGCEFRKLIPKRSIETESERNSVDHFRKSHSLVQW